MKSRGHWKLALLALFFLLPVGASYLIWWLDLAPGVTGNYGTLLTPRPVALPQSGDLKGKWVLRAQGKEMQRVARRWLLTDAVQPGPALLAAIEGTVVAPQAGAADFPAERDLAEHIYLVDPLGNLMMRFPRDPEPARVIKDIQRLLRASSFG